MPLDKEAATKEVTVEQLPETPADEEKCATPIETFIQPITSNPTALRSHPK
jgi:hypothetical protein